MRTEQNKRRAGKKKKRRRKPSKFAYFLLLLVVLFVALAVCSAIFLKVETVKITGESPYSADQIKNVSGITNETNLLRIDKNKVNKSICTSLPYIKDAKVKLRLPTTVLIEVTKDKPYYAINFNKQFVIADEDLKVLELTSDKSKTDNLISITGANISDVQPGQTVNFIDNNQLQLIKDLSAAVKEAKISKVTAYNIGTSYRLSVVYDSRITIVVGTQNEAARKLKDAAVIINTKMQPTDKGSLDVSAQNKRYTFSPS